MKRLDRVTRSGRKIKPTHYGEASESSDIDDDDDFVSDKSKSLSSLEDE